MLCREKRHDNLRSRGICGKLITSVRIELCWLPRPIAVGFIMDRNKEISYNNFLSYRPALDELIEQVNVGTKWLLFGTLLHLDDKKLDGIDQLPGHDNTMKTLKMFQLWLDTTPTASRRQILEVLRKSVVGENTLADEYEKYLKKLHETNCKLMH